MGTLHLLDCVTHHYDWGSATFIPELLGDVADGSPHAELWMGAHPGGSSVLTIEGRRVELREFIDSDPVSTLGSESVSRFGGTLPFLVKVLAADHPLSLQAHPSKGWASRRYAEEVQAGLGNSALVKLYKDGNHKPELICALTTFEALCGFRPLSLSARLFGSIDDPEAQAISNRLLSEDNATVLEAVVEDLLRRRIPMDGIVGAIRAALVASPDPSTVSSLTWCSQLADLFPNDPGAVISLLMNYVKLEPGEALSLPSGNLHAYLHGSGIELMANSDNVLRGGLTTKHIDVDELLAVVDWNPLIDPVVVAKVDGCIGTYPSPSDEFELTHIHIGVSSDLGEEVVELTVQGPEILICVGGEAMLITEHDQCSFRRGQVVFVEAATKQLSIHAKHTQIYRATIGSSAR